MAKSLLASPNDVKYPRGYSRRLGSVPDTHIHAGDEEIDQLYMTYLKGRVNHQGWRYRRQVISVAARLLRNFGQFLNQQSDNPYLYGFNYDFLLDTLKFIETGHRSMSVETWEGLLMENQPPNKDFKARPNFSVSQSPLSVIGSKTEDVISRWCAQPKGFEDMLKTLTVMFGKARHPLAGS